MNDRRIQLPPLGHLFGKAPPHNAEAEMALLGSLLIEPGRVGEIAGSIAAEDFYSERHAAIYAGLLAVVERGADTADLVILVDELRTRGQLELVGGPEYLVDLANSVPTAVNAEHYARLVAEKAQLRRLIDALSAGLYDAYHVGAGPDQAREILDHAQARVFDVCRRMFGEQRPDLPTLLEGELARLEKSEADRAIGIQTGLVDLDTVTGGLQPGEMIVVGARPSMGKTALSLTLAEQIAAGGAAPGVLTARPNVPVAFFSLEMSQVAIVQRLISSRSGLTVQTLRRGAIDNAAFKRAMIACHELKSLPIHIDDTPGLTITSLRARARQLAARGSAKVIFVDYLQLLTAPHQSESRQVEVSAISRGIKDLARELSVPVVCLAQLNRGTEDRAHYRPRMSDLRESGSIEQDADVVALLHREEHYHTGDEHWIAQNQDKIGVAELIVAKQRNGPTGVVKLRWDASAVRFRSFEPGVAPIAAAPGEPLIPV